MEKNSYVAYLKDKGIEDDQIEYAVQTVKKLQKFLNEKGSDLNTCSADDIQDYMDELIETDENTIKRIIFLARYFLSQKNNAIYIYFTQLLGVSGVIESIMNRFQQLVETKSLDMDLQQRIKILPVGSSPNQYPAFVKAFMKELKTCMDEKDARWVLAGNNHQIPSESFDEEKRYFQNADSIDDYLKGRHERAVERLRKHAEEGTVWFEQIITPDVVSFVRSNQEILGGVRQKNKIIITKIPYNPSEYIQEKDYTKKRYLACHCPFVRNHLQQNFSDIDPDWCYCSGGFAKAPFEHFYSQELKVEMIESCLTGSDRCRFAIIIPEENNCDL